MLPAPFVLPTVILSAQISVACPVGALPVTALVPLAPVPSIMALILSLQALVSSSDSQQADSGVDSPITVTGRGFHWHGRAVQPLTYTPPVQLGT